MTETRSFLVDGNRRRVAYVPGATGALDDPSELGFAYGLGDEAHGRWVRLAGSPFLERPLALGPLPLFAPFGRRPRAGFRELFVEEPRIGRLWGRFSVDVPVAMERSPKLVNERIFARLTEGFRVFIVEDGDRYALRGLCIFQVKDDVGRVVELLHDRSLDGMRAASHVLGLALRAMHDSGARVARAVALPHSGTVPILLRHAFRRVAGPSVLVQPLDEAIEHLATYPDGWYLSYLDFLEPRVTPPA